jgi:hypothetical protein
MVSKRNLEEKDMPDDEWIANGKKIVALYDNISDKGLLSKNEIANFKGEINEK